MMSVSDMLNLKGFENMEVIAGSNGLNRKVTTVSVMDAPDIYKWMKGGEFLITSAYPIKDDVAFITELILKLDQAGASAFGIKLHRFIDMFPDEAILLANELNFPLIHIPIEFAFTDIINPVLTAIIDKQGELLRFSEATHNTFTDIATKGKSVNEILDALEKIVSKETALIDTSFSKLYFSRQCSMLNKKIISINFEKFKLPNLVDVYLHPLEINSSVLGYIAVDLSTEELTDRDMVAIEHASTVMVLEIQKKTLSKQIQQKYRDEFVYDLLSNNIHSDLEIINRAELYGFNLSNGAVVAIVDVENFKQQYTVKVDEKINEELNQLVKQILEISKDIVRKNFKDSIYSKRSDHIVFIIPRINFSIIEFQIQLQETFTEVINKINSKYRINATIPIGTYQINSVEISKSYERAKKCLEICRKTGIGNRVVFYDKLGIHKLISIICQCEEADEFYLDNLGGLLIDGNSSKYELLNTLICVVDCNWNLREAARKLYIHYNSMKYRYAKICEILDMDLKNQRNRFQIEMAIELYKIKKK
jgi:purine catabolism regulator